MAIPKGIFNHLPNVETHVLRKGHVLFVYIDHVFEAVGGFVFHTAALDEAVIFVRDGNGFVVKVDKVGRNAVGWLRMERFQETVIPGYLISDFAAVD